MKKESTGKFKSREELEAYVIEHHLRTGATASTARLAGVSDTTIRKIIKEYYAGLETPIHCPKCKVTPTVEPMVGRRLICQCQECGECGRPADSRQEAVQHWNEKSRLTVAASLPRRLGK